MIRTLNGEEVTRFEQLNINNEGIKLITEELEERISNPKKYIWDKNNETRIEEIKFILNLQKEYKENLK